MLLSCELGVRHVGGWRRATMGWREKIEELMWFCFFLNIINMDYRCEQGIIKIRMKNS